MGKINLIIILLCIFLTACGDDKSIGIIAVRTDLMRQSYMESR